jgi:hypothetical protein
MHDSSPERDEIKYLEALQEFLVNEWQSTQDPATKAVVEELAKEIRRRRDLE